VFSASFRGKIEGKKRMIIQKMIPKHNTFQINIPSSYINHEIEIIIFSRKEVITQFQSQPNNEVDFIEELINNPRHIPAKVSFFSRDEANER
jgi:hypothetical protein